MRNPCLTAVLEELATAGIRRPEIANGGKHMQVRWTTASGQRRSYTLPNSPSDWRAPENARHGVRRVLRADGMLEMPEPRTSPLRQPSRLELVERRLPRSSAGWGCEYSSKHDEALEGNQRSEL